MTKHSGKSVAGFTLVEMAFIVLIAGLFIGAAVSFMPVEDDARKQELTRERMQKIAVVLSGYAESHGVIPCPGYPDAANLGEMGSGCGGYDGIVPFRELGMSQEEVTDGYGNPITYAATEAATTHDDDTPVDSKCRVDPTWIDSGIPLNPWKARLCCPVVPDSSAITVTDIDGNSVAVTQSAGASIDADRADVPSGGPSGETLTYLAYVLVSHGKNGLGAYIWNSSARRTTTGIGSAEGENADSDRDYKAIMPQMASGDVFDDIVLWRTQEQLVSETGGTCDLP